VKCKFDSGRFMENLKAVRKHKKSEFSRGWVEGDERQGDRRKEGRGVGRKGPEECERLGGL